jgi:hypothetical protein
VVSEANDRLFLFQPAPWKSAAKRSLCGNLLTFSFSRPHGSPPQSEVFAAIFSPSLPAVPMEVRESDLREDEQSS